MSAQNNSWERQPSVDNLCIYHYLSHSLSLLPPASCSSFLQSIWCFPFPSSSVFIASSKRSCPMVQDAASWNMVQVVPKLEPQCWSVGGSNMQEENLHEGPCLKMYAKCRSHYGIDASPSCCTLNPNLPISSFWFSLAMSKYLRAELEIRQEHKKIIIGK